jgi:uncharacterized protein DUF6959
VSETIQVELLANVTNSPILRMPGRRFPGVLILGDSLASLHFHAARLVKCCADEDLREASFEAAELQQQLQSYLLMYDRALVANGMRPFFRRNRSSESSEETTSQETSPESPDQSHTEEHLG